MKHFPPEIKSQIDLLDAGLPPTKDAGIFGASIPEEYCSLVLIPVPWELTTSYGKGTSLNPKKIISVSHQLDLFDRHWGAAYKKGICMLPENERILELDKNLASDAALVIRAVEDQLDIPTNSLDKVNQAGANVNTIVQEISSKYLKEGKKVGVVGGDHSSPFGLISALASDREFGILHIDAHLDLRCAYEGFHWSHASIMSNVLENIDNVSKIVSIGIRDYSEDEYRIASENPKVEVWFDDDLYIAKSQGKGWIDIVEKILRQLPSDVYISLDIDGLDPLNCPSTGTPVPGGFSFQEIIYLLDQLKRSGKNIIGFDLCEVGAEEASEWDQNVAARLLYKLCSVTLAV